MKTLMTKRDLAADGPPDPPTVVACLVRVLLVFSVCAVLLAGRAWARERAIENVVVVIVDRTSLRAWSEQPAFRHLMRKGAFGLVNSKGARGVSSSKAAVTLNAISLADATASSSAVFNAGETPPSMSIPAGEVFFQNTGKTLADWQLCAIEFPTLAQMNLGKAAGGGLGLLGDLVHERGGFTIALGCSDAFAGAGEGAVRLAGAAALDSSGCVDAGDVSQTSLYRDLGAPFGVRTDWRRLTVGWILPALADGKKELIVLEMGDTYRADVVADRCTEEQAQRHYLDAMAAAGACLEEIGSRIDPHRDILIVVSFVPSKLERGELGAGLLYGGPFSGGKVFDSLSTRHSGVAVVPDISATIANSFGAKLPRGSGGSVLRVGSGGGLARLVRLNSIISLTDSFLREFLLAVLAVAAGVSVLLAMAAWGGKRPRVFGAALFGLMWSAFFPFFLMIVGGLMTNVSTAQVGATAAAIACFSVACAVVAASIVFAVARRNVRTALALIGWAYIAGLLVHLAAPRTFLFATVIGYSPYFGGRFHGIGNEAMSLFFGGALLAMAATVWSGSEGVVGWRPRLVWALVFAAIVLALALPQLGADFGGAVGAVAGFGAAMWGLSRRPFGRRQVVYVVLGVVVCIAGFVCLSLVRSSAVPSHLSRWVGTANEGIAGPFFAEIGNKARIWGKAFRYPWWDFMFVTVLAAIGYLATVGKRGSQAVLEKLPGMRGAVLGALVGGTVAFLINDSGPIVPSLIALLTLGPLMVILLAKGENR